MSEQLLGPSAHPLGLSLGFFEGAALVTLQDHTLTEGLVVRALELELPDVSLPLDLQGGAEEFQRRSTKLRSLILDVELGLLAKELAQVLERIGSPLSKPALKVDGNQAVLEAVLTEGEHSAPIGARLLFAPGEAPQNLRLYVIDSLVFGYVPVSAVGLPDLLEQTIKHRFEQMEGQGLGALSRLGASSLGFDPIAPILWALLPRHGWKLPDHRSAKICGVELTSEGVLRISVGRAPISKHSSLFPVGEDQVLERALLLALGREEAQKAAEAADVHLIAGDLRQAFEEMQMVLDASGGPEVITERMFSIGISLPELHPKTSELAEDELAQDPQSIFALLAKGAIADHQGFSEQAAIFYEQAARALKAQGRRRLAGLAYRVTSRYRADIAQERCRLLEETIALRPDDEEALKGLIEELPAAGRKSAAVRAARRLASLRRAPAARAQAHTIAGQLLLEDDPATARREFERAQRLSPDAPETLEGLAKAFMALGESRRAAQLFDKLIQKAEEAQELERAVELSLHLGDLWTPIDPEAAMVRYRSALALTPGSAKVQGRLALAATQAGREEVALEAIEPLLPDFEGVPEDQALPLRLAAGQLLATKRKEEAVRQYEAALAVQPEHEGAAHALLSLYEEQPDKQAEVLGRRAAILVRNGQPEQLDEAASLYLRRAGLLPKSELPQVRAQVLSALERHSAHRGLLDTLVSISERADDPAVLVDALDRRLLVDDQPAQRGPLLTKLGKALHRAQRTADAVRAFELAAHSEPVEPEAVLALMKIHRARDDRERLSQVLSLAAELADSAEARAAHLTERARLLLTLKKREEALDTVLSALTAAPDNSEVLELAIDLAVQLGRYDEARKLTKDRLATLNPQDRKAKIDALLALAQVAEALDDTEELHAALNEAYELVEPGSDLGLMTAARLSDVLASMGDKEALASLERKRGRVASMEPQERAERFINAAQLAVQIGASEQAEQDVRDALALLDAAGHTQLRLGALSVLEALARHREDPQSLSEVIGRRAAVVSTPKEKVHLLLEQASVLEQGGLLEQSAALLEDVRNDFPESVDVVRRLGQVSEQLDWTGRAGDAYGRAAQLLSQDKDVAGAIVEHSRAAESFAKAKAMPQAVLHDRAVLRLSSKELPQGVEETLIASSLERLEAHARADEDHALLAEVLGRLARLSAPAQAAALLLEKAKLESQLADDKSALESLRRARSLCPPKERNAQVIEEALCENLERLGQFADQATVLVEAAERATEPARKSELYLRAAKVYEQRLSERKMALSRAQAAVRADPGSEEARAMRLSLLREGGRPQALVEALFEEAENARDAERAAALWLEAAELLAPSDALSELESSDVERALLFVRRAATASLRSAEPLSKAAVYTRALGRPDEEFVALGQLLERDIKDPERTAVYLRRMELLAGPLDDTVAAQAELSLALEAIDSVQPDASPSALLGARGPARALVGALRQGLRLTELNEDWSTHVRFLMRLVELSDDIEERADLRQQAGETLEWKLGDGEAAEREYRTALALMPAHAGSKKALRSFYSGMDRFADLAENLGVDLLKEVWQELSAQPREAASRKIACAQALWPRMEHGEARAQVQLQLADLYTVNEGEAADVVHVLEDVVQTAPPEDQDAALARLRVLFLENERFDLYCDVLRRQIERIDEDGARALALTDLGEALEWQLGDWQAAEREYQAALALDPLCLPARQKLAELLSSQDRFEELKELLGAPMLETVVFELLSQGPRDGARALNAAQVYAASTPEPERFWMRIADASESLELLEKSLEQVAGSDNEEARSVRLEALERLERLYEERSDRSALRGVLQARLKLVEKPEDALALRLALAELSLESYESEPTEEGAQEAEGHLRAVLDLDPEHAQAREHLSRLYLAQGRLQQLGEVLGLDALIRVKDAAEEDETLRKSALEALVELETGDARAEHQLALALLLDEPAEQKRLYQEVLEVRSEDAQAKLGLREVLLSQGQYREIAESLGVETLQEIIGELKEGQEELLPASLALVSVDEDAEATTKASRWVEIAKLHQLEEDLDSQEHALMEALELQPGNATAREELRAMLAGAGRLEDLAEVDEALVEKTAKLAQEASNEPLEREALRVLAERAQSSRRAQRMMALYEHHLRLGATEQAEHHLREALAADENHAKASEALQELLWSQERYHDLIESLSGEHLISRAERALSEDAEGAHESGQAELVAAALGGVQEALPPPSRARALELLAQLRGPSDVSPEEEFERRKEQLTKARGLWDDSEGVESEVREAAQVRVRMSLLELLREHDEPAQGLLEALEDASAYAKDSSSKGALSVERARLLLMSEQHEEASAVLQPLIDEEIYRRTDRIEAARIWVDSISTEPEEALEDESLAQRERALTLLTHIEAARAYPQSQKRWLFALASARERLAFEMEKIARPLEAALRIAEDRDEVLQIRRRLRDIYEQLGDWKRAEVHASIIAKADDQPQLWVALSELRVWLDDRRGAEEALESALKLEPSSIQAHEGLLRLAEQSGDTGSVIDTLERWVRDDEVGDRNERAERLLKAAWIAVGRVDDDRATELAEQAIALMPSKAKGLQQVVTEACQVFEQTNRPESKVSALTRLVGELQVGEGTQERLQLADLLIELDRKDQAEAVIEQGIHKNTPESDPLLARRIEDALQGPWPSDEAARRLLKTADRIGAGPAARKLRLVAAEKAEEVGNTEIAKTAWSNVVSQVGGSSEQRRARQALLRLTRTLDDPPALLEALLDAVDDAPSPEARRGLLVEAAEVASERMEQPARAEALLQRALEEVPEHAQTQERLVALFEKRGRWGELVEQLERRAEELKGAQKAELLIQQAEITQKQLKEEKKSAELRKDAYEAAPSVALGEAAVLAFLSTGQPQKAAELAHRVLAEVRPEDQEALRVELLRVRALEAAGRVEEATEVIGRAGGREAKMPLLRAKRIDLLFKHQRWQQLAETLLEAAEDVEPALGLRYRLAATRILLERQGDKESAKRSLSKAVRMIEGWLSEPEAEVPERLALGPLDGSAAARRASGSSPLFDLASLAEALGSHGDRLDVLRLYAQSLPAGPEQWRVLMLLAKAEREVGELDAAEFTLRGVVDAVRPATGVSVTERVEAERSLGALLLERGEAAEAAQALQHAASLLEGDAQAPVLVRAQTLVQLAEAYRKLDRDQEVLAALSQARVLMPQLVPTADFERAVEAAGPSEALARLFEQRASQKSQRAENLREAARIWTEIGRRDRAFKPLRKAYEADPTDTKEAQRLSEALYQAERWGELELFLARRLQIEELTEPERVALMSSRAAVLYSRLGRVEEALELLLEARALDPVSLEVLMGIVDYAEALGQDELAQDALARLATMVRAPRAKRSALLRRAQILERNHKLGAAILCWEEVYKEALKGAHPPRAIARRLSRLYQKKGDAAAQVRVWGRLVPACEGAEEAAMLQWIAKLRIDQLSDQRGATAALEAAVKAAPEDLGLRRSVMEHAAAAGDFARARGHASEAARIARQESELEAYLTFLLEEARLAGLLGDAVSELECFKAILEERPGTPAVLSELVVRAREALPGEDALRLLVARIASLESGRVRGRHRFAQARILEEPLGRHWEAEGVREDAERDDFGGEKQPEPPVDQLDGRVSFEESYRSQRALLDRSGRWEELLELEERRAGHLDNPAAQADALHSVAKLHVRMLPSGWQDRLQGDGMDPDVRFRVDEAKRALERALGACPSFVPALAELARLESMTHQWTNAQIAIDRLELVGGPGWPAPQFELLAAQVAEQTDELDQALARLFRARERDPGSTEVLFALARVCKKAGRTTAAMRWLETLSASLDPQVDRAMLADCWVEQAQLERGEQALSLIHAALDLVPEHEGALALRRRGLELAGPSTQLLNILEDDARRQSPQAAEALLLQAFSVADTEQRRLRLARRLESYSAGATFERLLSFYRDRGDGSGLMRLAEREGLERLGVLGWEATAALAAAYLAADRREEGLSVWVQAQLTAEDFVRCARRLIGILENGPGRGDATLLQVVSRSRELLMPEPVPLSSNALRLLELLRERCSEGQRSMEILAELYQIKRVKSEGAIKLYRRLLRSDSADVEVIEILQDALKGLGQNAEHVQAALRFLHGAPRRTSKEEALPRIHRRPEQKVFLEQLAHGAVFNPLGELLRVTAKATAAILPPAESMFQDRIPAVDLPRVAEVASSLAQAAQDPFEVWIDPEGDDTVWLEPGEPPRLVVGEALVEDASPQELRFHLGRAYMLLEMGYLLVQTTGGGVRRTFMELLLASVDLETTQGAPEGLEEALDGIRSRLGPMGLAQMEPHIEALNELFQKGMGAGDRVFERWRHGVEVTANRFGLLLSGSLDASVKALRRAEPRTLAEDFEGQEARIASVRRWTALSDLLAFVLSENYMRMTEAT